MLWIARVARQLLTRIAGAQNVYSLVTGSLCKRPIKRDKLVPNLTGVFVDRRKERRRLGQSQIGLIESNLGCVDGLGLDHPAFFDGAPVPGIG